MITASATADGGDVTAAIDVDGERYEVLWRFTGAEPSAGLGEAVLAATILPAMRTGGPLAVAHDVSPRLLDNVAVIQDVFCTWSRRKKLVTGTDPGFGRVDVDTRGPERRAPAGCRGTAAFFSGGVDSFYTVLRHRDILTALVFVHGIDVRLDDPLRQSVVDGVRAAAREFGLPLIEVETDLRKFSDRFVRWEDSHGAALAAIAHLLTDRFATIVVSATHTYDTLYPLGSHPLLDPLWASEDLAIVHDGCEADRVEKARAIGASSTARTWLRVCPRYSTDRYNCGRCEKCLRTMAAIRLAGVTDEFATLPPLAGAQMIARVAATRVRGRGATWKGYRRVAQRERRDRALQGAISIALVRHWAKGLTPRSLFKPR